MEYIVAKESDSSRDYFMQSSKPFSKCPTVSLPRPWSSTTASAARSDSDYKYIFSKNVSSNKFQHDYNTFQFIVDVDPLSSCNLKITFFSPISVHPIGHRASPANHMTHFFRFSISRFSDAN